MTLFERLRFCVYSSYKTSYDTVVKQWCKAWLDGYDRSEEGTQTVQQRGRFPGALAAQAAAFIERGKTDSTNQKTYEHAAEQLLDIAFSILEKDRRFDADIFAISAALFPEEGVILPPEKYRPYIVNRVRKLTPEEFKQKLREQNDRCAICKKHWKVCKKPTRKGEIQKFGLVQDHNHTTGANRGLLCTRCNLMVGSTQESKEIVEWMIEYLIEYNSYY